MRELPALLKAFKGADYVLHHAALVSVPRSVEEPLDTWRINVTGTANVLEAARRTGVKRVVFASSCSVYGTSSKPCKETNPKNPALRMRFPNKSAKNSAAFIPPFTGWKPFVCVILTCTVRARTRMRRIRPSSPNF